MRTPFRRGLARRLRRSDRDYASNAVVANIVRYHAGRASPGAAPELRALVEGAERISVTSFMPIWRVRFEAVAATTPDLPILERGTIVEFLDEEARAFPVGISEGVLALARLDTGADAMWSLLHSEKALEAGPTFATELALSRVGDSRLRDRIESRLGDEDPSFRDLGHLARLGVDLGAAADRVGLAQKYAEAIHAHREWIRDRANALPQREGVEVELTFHDAGSAQPKVDVTVGGEAVSEAEEVQIAVFVSEGDTPYLVGVDSYAYEPASTITHRLPGLYGFESMRPLVVQVTVGEHVERTTIGPPRYFHVQQLDIHGGYSQTSQIVELRCRGERRLGVTDLSGVAVFPGMPAGPCERGDANFREEL
jgi:hypothetical protein